LLFFTTLCFGMHAYKVKKKIVPVTNVPDYCPSGIGCSIVSNDTLAAFSSSLWCTCPSEIAWRDTYKRWSAQVRNRQVVTDM